MSSNEKPKKLEQIKIGEKKITDRELDNFLGYVLAPSSHFPLKEDGVSDVAADPVPGPLEIRVLFLRGTRESDAKRKPREDGKPYPSWFTLSHESCKQRLDKMIAQKKSRKQAQIAVEKWPENQEGVKLLGDVLIEFGLSP